ncbi:MAG: YncE family protein, partial [Solirubrobacteraceae bacterium]
ALEPTPAGQVTRGTVTPAPGDPRVVLDRRARVLRTPAGSAPAGVGPTQVVSDGGELLYVTDTAGDGVLVFHTRPRLELTRRVGLPGGAPYAMALDLAHDRLWVTLTRTNEVAELLAGPKPGVLGRRPSVRQPDAIAVDARSGTVTVAGAGGVLQRFDRSR